MCEAQGCTEPLVQAPTGRPRHYCSTKCRKRANERKAPRSYSKALNQQRVSRADSEDGRASMRRPPERFLDEADDWVARLDAGAASQDDVAAEFDTSRANVSRWIAWMRDEMVTRAARAGWTAPTLIRLPSPDDPDYDAKLDEIVERFARFRGDFFQDEKGDPYQFPDHQRRWTRVFFHALATGGKQLVLSPPRHGKTALVAHICVFLICLVNPNIRILCVGGNEDIAAQTVAAILDLLENNERLIEAHAGPGGSFKPPNRSGKTWSQSKFTVGTRTVQGIKSPTMVAVGKGGKLLSRDADLIIGDDLDDPGSTYQPTARENTRHWFSVALSSRKTRSTAMFIIGSRQNVEDIYAHLLEAKGWGETAIVESAHNPECALDPDDVTIHTDCMLWRGNREVGYEWLLDEQHTYAATSGISTFRMVYLNQVGSDSTVIFNREDVEACRNWNRLLGDRSAVPARCDLIAGIDPAASGMQAAVLWAVDTEASKLYLLDLENERAGSIPHLVSIIRRWHADYGLMQWVYEANSQQLAWLSAREVVELRQTLGVRIREHTTGHNKNDNRYGVNSMAPWFEDQPGIGRRIDLPYGDVASRRATDMYVHQLRNYSPHNPTRGSGWKNDLVMAGWFPWESIKKRQQARLGEQSSPWERKRHNSYVAEFTAEAFRAPDFDFAA